MLESINVLGEKLKPCCKDPVTGFYRDGHCNTGHEDHGMHTVCVRLTQEFLEFSKEAGNDLSTPRPEYGFTGLKPGQQWCLCAGRWLEAYNENKAPPVILESTHEETLAVAPLSFLQKFSF